LIITRTPYRISFFGGGSDYPDWYLKNGGEIISSTIDKFVYISSRDLPKFFSHNYRVSYSIVATPNNVTFQRKCYSEKKIIFIAKIMFFIIC